jgi:hypothetical protein
MTDGQLRFSLAERKPGTIQSPGGGSGKTVALDDESARQTLQTIHKASAEAHGVADWILLTYTGADLTALKEVGHGSGGVSELVSHLNDSLIAYGLLRVVDVVDGIPTTRFAYITWIGDSVPGVTKARVGTNKGAVTEIIGHYNVEVIASQKSELTQDSIMGRVQDASGSRMREVENKTTQPLAKGTSGPTGAVKTTATTPRSQVPTQNQAVTFLDHDGLKNIQKGVRNDKGSDDWMLIGYKDKTELELVGHGSGGLDELKQHLTSDKVFYGFLKVPDGIDASKFYRFFFINFVGTNVSPMLKGKIATHKGAVSEFYEPFHLLINAEDKSELTNQLIQEKLQSLKGSK